MFYLFLSVCIQVWNAQVLRFGESSQQERLVVIGFNYILAMIGGALAWMYQGMPQPSAITWALGPIGGFFYFVSLLFWMKALAPAGVAVSTAVMRLGVLWPVLLSVFYFAEVPTLAQLGGILLTVLVLVLLGMDSRRPKGGIAQEPAAARRGLITLLLLFATMGGTMISQKLFTEWAPPEEKSFFLLLVFYSAGLMTWMMILTLELPLRFWDGVRGSIFGIGNITGNTFLLMGLSQVPGVVAFPLVSTSVILLTAMSGVLIWKERPGILAVLAILTAAAAIYLMT